MTSRPAISAVNGVGGLRSRGGLSFRSMGCLGNEIHLPALALPQRLVALASEQFGHTPEVVYGIVSLLVDPTTVTRRSQG